jgi:hypothetical protein
MMLQLTPPPPLESQAFLAVGKHTRRVIVQVLLPQRQRGHSIFHRMLLMLLIAMIGQIALLPVADLMSETRTFLGYTVSAKAVLLLWRKSFLLKCLC